MRIRFNPAFHSNVVSNLRAEFRRRFKRELTLLDEQVWDAYDDWCTVVDEDHPDDADRCVMDALVELAGGGDT